MILQRAWWMLPFSMKRVSSSDPAVINKAFNMYWSLKESRKQYYLEMYANAMFTYSRSLSFRRNFWLKCFIMEVAVIVIFSSRWRREPLIEVCTNHNIKAVTNEQTPRMHPRDENMLIIFIIVDGPSVWKCPKQENEGKKIESDISHYNYWIENQLLIFCYCCKWYVKSRVNNDNNKVR